MDEPIQVKAKRLVRAASLPARSYDDDSGFDLRAIEAAVIAPRRAVRIRTGLALQLPPGTEAQIRPRSGLAINHMVTVLNSPGTIDEGFRGEIVVILVNHGELPFRVVSGMRVAQLVIQRKYMVDMVEVSEVYATGRGDKGLGSTGE